MSMPRQSQQCQSQDRNVLHEQTRWAETTVVKYKPGSMSRHGFLRQVSVAPMHKAGVLIT